MSEAIDKKVGGEMGGREIERERWGESERGWEVQEKRVGKGRGGAPHHTTPVSITTLRGVHSTQVTNLNETSTQRRHTFTTHTRLSCFYQYGSMLRRLFGVNRCFVSALRNLLKNVNSFGDDGQRSIWCHVIYTYIHQGN